MPNQRKKGKTKVGLWVDEVQNKRLQELAKIQGISVSDLIKEAIRLYDKECEVKNEH